jgi:hypothetical protein
MAVKPELVLRLRQELEEWSARERPAHGTAALRALAGDRALEYCLGLCCERMCSHQKRFWVGWLAPLFRRCPAIDVRFLREQRNRTSTTFVQLPGAITETIRRRPSEITAFTAKPPRTVCPRGWVSISGQSLHTLGRLVEHLRSILYSAHVEFDIVIHQKGVP